MIFHLWNSNTKLTQIPLEGEETFPNFPCPDSIEVMKSQQRFTYWKVTESKMGSRKFYIKKVEEENRSILWNEGSYSGAVVATQEDSIFASYFHLCISIRAFLFSIWDWSNVLDISSIVLADRLPPIPHIHSQLSLWKWSRFLFHHLKNVWLLLSVEDSHVIEKETFNWSQRISRLNNILILEAYVSNKKLSFLFQSESYNFCFPLIFSLTVSDTDCITF